MREKKIFKLIDFCVGIPLCIFFGLISKFFHKRKLNKFAKKILIIKLSALGDTILLLPVIKEIKSSFQSSNLSIVVTEINRAVLENFKYIDKTILFDPKKHILSPLSALNFFFKLFCTHYDIVIDADQWLRVSAIMSFFTFAKIRIGFKTKGQYKHFIFTDIIKHNKYIHELECFFDLVKPLNIFSEHKNLLPLHDNAEIKEIEKLQKKYNIISKFVILHPEVPSHGKQRAWDLKNFALLGNKLKENYGYKLVITSSFAYKELAEALNKLLGNSAAIISGLSIKLLSAFVSKAEFVICSNTGFMHLAAASGTKVVALHGPTNAVKWGPWGGVGKEHIIIKSPLFCSPCLYLGFEYNCKTNECMKAITVDAVANEIKKYLS